MSLSARELGLSFARLMRPQNTRFSTLFFWLPQLMGVLHWANLLGGTALIILLYGASTIYNDLRDEPIDRANKRQLPIAQQQLKPTQARVLLKVIIGAILLLNIVLPQPETGLYSCAYLFLGWAYSAPGIRLSHRGLWGTILLGACYLGLPIALGMVYAGLSVQLYAVSAAVLLAAPVLLYKDFKDIRGDRAHGKRTPVVRYGQIVSKSLTFVFFGIGFGLLVGFYAATPPMACWGILATLALALSARFDDSRHYWLLLYMACVVFIFASLFWQ